MEKPSLFQRIFRKPSRGVVISACSPDCAAKVKSDPGTYLIKVIAERSGWQK